MSTPNLQKVEKTFGERLKALRDEHNWTMRDLAERIDVSTGSIGNWENAPPTKPIIPEAKTLAKLAAALEVSTSYLLYGEIAEAEGGGNLKEVARWKDRALKAERQLETIKNVMQSASGLLAQVAGETITNEGKQKPKVSSGKSPEDQVAEAAEERAAELRRHHRDGHSSSKSK